MCFYESKICIMSLVCTGILLSPEVWPETAIISQSGKYGNNCSYIYISYLSNLPFHNQQLPDNNKLCFQPLSLDFGQNDQCCIPARQYQYTVVFILLCIRTAGCLFPRGSAGITRRKSYSTSRVGRKYPYLLIEILKLSFKKCQYMA